MTTDVAAHWKMAVGSSLAGSNRLSEDEGVTLVALDDATLPATHVVTVGLSERSVPDAPNRTELVCSTRPGQQEAAAFLLKMSMDMADRGWRLVYGSQGDNSTTLLARTQISGFVLVPLMWFSGADYTERPDGMIDVQFTQLLPLTRSELDLLDQLGTEHFFERLNSADVDFLDITRGSFVS